jgi:hypothetical protein
MWRQCCQVGQGHLLLHSFPWQVSFNTI